MTFVILYRSPETGEIYPVTADEACGVREFDSRDKVMEYLDTAELPDNVSGLQAVELLFL